MSDYYRITVLTLCCFIGYLCYWLFSLVVIVYAEGYCLSLSDYWFSDARYGHAYAWFLVLFSLLSLWACSEVLALLQCARERRIKISILVVIFIFLLGCFCQHYALRQTIAIQRGEITYNDYLLKIKDYKLESARVVLEKAIWKSWPEFFREKRCQKGVYIYSMTDDELRILQEEYRAYRETTKAHQ